MTVMPIICLVLYVCRVDSDTTGLLLGSLVNFRVVCELGTSALCENFGDGGGKGGLAMIDVT